MAKKCRNRKIFITTMLRSGAGEPGEPTEPVVPLPQSRMEHSSIQGQRTTQVSDGRVALSLDPNENNELLNNNEIQRPFEVYNHMSFAGNEVLHRNMDTISFDNDQDGEFMMVLSKKVGDRYGLGVGFGFSNNNTTWGILGIGGLPENNGSYIRFNNSRLKATQAKSLESSLGWKFISIGSNGTSYFSTDDNVNVAMTADIGSNNGDWMERPIGVIGIGAMTRLNPVYGLVDIAYVGYFDTKLSTADRQTLIDHLKKKMFGSLTPPNLSKQIYTPTQTFVNGKYNWDGGVSQNPITGVYTSVWSEGISHYYLGDLHVIMAQNSTDGTNYGPQYLVAQHAANQSLSNPSVGHSFTGRLIVIYTKIDQSQGNYDNVGLFSIYSDNDGSSWSPETQVSGVTQFGILNSCSKIIQLNYGALMVSYYEGSKTGTISVRMIRSTDNGVTWSKYSTVDTGTYAVGVNNEQTSETTTTILTGSTLLNITRVNGKGWYNQYISTDNGLNWTKQGKTSFNDYWQAYTAPDNNSATSHLPRTAKFVVSGVTVVACIYLNRGINVLEGVPSYLHIVFGRANELISKGVEGWASASGIRWTIPGDILDRLDGYPDIIFPSDNSRAIIRIFRDLSPPGSSSNGSETNILYFEHTFDFNWLKKILLIP